MRGVQFAFLDSQRVPRTLPVRPWVSQAPNHPMAPRDAVAVMAMIFAVLSLRKSVKLLVLANRLIYCRVRMLAWTTCSAQQRKALYFIALALAMRKGGRKKLLPLGRPRELVRALMPLRGPSVFSLSGDRGFGDTLLHACVWRPFRARVVFANDVLLLRCDCVRCVFIVGVHCH